MNTFRLITFGILASFSLSGNLSFSTSTEKNKKTITSYLKEINDALVQSRIMSRDSGRKVDIAFLSTCIKEKTETYLQFYCGDLLWPHHVVLLQNNYIYLVADGASVENRALFRLSNKKVIVAEDNLPHLLTIKKVNMLLNKQFPKLKMTEARLESIAHSQYRTKVPRGIDQTFIIYPGELGQENKSYIEIPIGKATWTGQKFKLLD